MIQSAQSVSPRGHRIVALVMLLIATSAPANGPRIFAITDVRIVTAPGQVIDRGTVVLRDGLIDAVGANVEAPPDALVIVGQEAWTVYPAFIDAASSVGLEPASSNGTPDRKPAADRPGAPHELESVQPETAAVDQLNTDHSSLARHRELGFGVAHVLPGKGVFRGESTVILLRDAPARELILVPRMAQVVAFEKSSFMARQYPSSSIGAVAAVRQTLFDAQRQLTWNERYAARPIGMQRPQYQASDPPLLAVLRDARPVVFVAQADLDPGRFRAITAEFGLRAMTVVSGLGQRPDNVLAADMPILLTLALPEPPELTDPDAPLDTTLREMQAVLRAPRLPVALADSNVEFAFVTLGMESVRDFPETLAAVVEAGLPADRALAAVTTVPARLLELDQVLGTIERGKQANLLVVEGELFTAKPALRHLFVDGYHQEIKTEDRIGDPTAVVDPRGTWEISTTVMGRSSESTWTITGTENRYKGFTEASASGKRNFKRVDLTGNALTVVSPTSRGELEITVVIAGDRLEGDTTMESPRGSAKLQVEGRRISTPEAQQ